MRPELLDGPEKRWREQRAEHDNDGNINADGPGCSQLRLSRSVEFLRRQDLVTLDFVIELFRW